MRLSMRNTRQQVYATTNAISNLTQAAGSVRITVEADKPDGFESGWLRGAVLDVFETEPLPPSSPFWELENVLLSPHCADHTPGWLESAVDLFVENFGRFLRGAPLENVVDKKRGY